MPREEAKSSIGQCVIDNRTLFVEVESMERDAVKNELLHFKGDFKLDFTEEYLNSISEVKLKHILLAARLQALMRNPI